MAELIHTTEKSKIKINSSKLYGTPFFQPKLSVNQPNDVYEKEADAIADKVISKEAPGVKNSFFAPSITSHIHRKCEHCEEEEKVQRKESSGESLVSEAISDQIFASKGNGRSMDGNTQAFMENRFGVEFSNVKIHTGNEAAQMSKELNAKAFTVGNDIYFNRGQYQPNSDGGKHLLAHELTHTIQQASGIHRDTEKEKAEKAEKAQKEEAELKSLQKNISAGDWMNAYQYLWGLAMDTMLPKLNSLTESEITNLISNADVAKNTPGCYIGEFGKNWVLAGLLAAKSVKKQDMTDAEIETAKQKGMIVTFDDRIEIIKYLSKSKSKAAKKLHTILNKPLLGYMASAYDFSDRFLKHSDKLGFDIEASATTLPQTTWDKDDPDPQTTMDTNTATESFEKSDVLFFSGHQYAQYKRPGLFTNDTSDSCFNIGAISKKINKVKLVISTSCATICKDTAHIFTGKFPNAMVLGYKYSAPSNGGTVSTAFVNSLTKKGALDLTSTTGLDAVRDSWKTVTTSNAGKEGQPGILYNGEVEFYNGKKWEKVKADSKENDCHYH